MKKYGRLFNLSYIWPNRIYPRRPVLAPALSLMLVSTRKISFLTKISFVPLITVPPTIPNGLDFEKDNLICPKSITRERTIRWKQNAENGFNGAIPPTWC
ncbi:unnamed protein product [Cuscuta campestris]|uniref:Uncharacterized protein n=1 Tax=Cuscuta campestris TaxID=132261 RepID=A0A484KG63_9ASTE|nr:unnamed protein product [Cuscuta campestris]